MSSHVQLSSKSIRSCLLKLKFYIFFSYLTNILGTELNWGLLHEQYKLKTSEASFYPYPTLPTREQTIVLGEDVEEITFLSIQKQRKHLYYIEFQMWG